MTLNSVETVQERLLLRPKEAARMLAVSERTLWGSGIPRIRVGKRGIRYALDDLRRWVESRRAGSN
jgi:hypothetical protein